MLLWLVLTTFRWRHFRHLRWTTIQQNTTLAGEMLVVNLLKLIAQQGIEQTEIEPKIIIRRSCGASLNLTDI